MYFIDIFTLLSFRHSLQTQKKVCCYFTGNPIIWAFTVLGNSVIIDLLQIEKIYIYILTL